MSGPNADLEEHLTMSGPIPPLVQLIADVIQDRLESEETYLQAASMVVAALGEAGWAIVDTRN